MPGIFSNLNCCSKKPKPENNENPPPPPADGQNPPESEVPPEAPPEENLPPADAPIADPAGKSPESLPKESTNEKADYEINVYFQGLWMGQNLQQLMSDRENFITKITKPISRLFSKKPPSNPIPPSTTLMNYSCPICTFISPGVQSWKHFEKCMIDKLKNDPCNYAIYCVLSLNPPETVEICKNLIIKYFKSLIKNPKEDKFRKIRLKSELFYECVFPLIGGLTIFEIAGFQYVLNKNDNPAEMYMEIPPNVGTEAARLVLNWLSIARPISPNIFRGLKFITLSNDEKLKYLDNPENSESKPPAQDDGNTSTTGWAHFAQVDHRCIKIFFDVCQNKGFEASFLVTETVMDVFDFLEPLFKAKTGEISLQKIGILFFIKTILI